MGHDNQIVMMRVVQHQYGGLFLRFSWDSGILVLHSLVVDTKARASSCFHEFGSIVKHLVEGLSKLLQHQDALLIGSSQEDSYDSTLSDHVASRRCFTSPRLVWDPSIIFNFNPIHSEEGHGVEALLKDKQSWKGRIVMSLSRPKIIIILKCHLIKKGIFQ